MDPSTSSSAAEPDSIPDEVFADINRTELYQLCRQAGLHVHPAWDRLKLVRALQDRLAPEDLSFEHPVDSIRDALIAFIDQHWRTLRPQLKCPAKDLKNPDLSKRNERPCFGCSDMQVTTCFSEQRPENQARIIQLRKKQP